MTATWGQRVDAVWSSAGHMDEAGVVAAIDDLVSERPPDDPRAAFEAASARDFAGQEAEAVGLYERALKLGLEEPHRGQALIQYASTLRNLGRTQEALAALDRLAAGDPLADAAAAFRALALTDAGRHPEAVRVALNALAEHLPQYARAVRAYADELVAETPGGGS